MITSAKFNELKKGNITADKKKTMERIPAVYKAATTEQKAEIKKLTGFSPTNFYSVEKSGTASPKVVVALSQTLNINPLYLTGESDVKSPCDNAVLTKIISENSGKGKPIKAKPAVAKDKPTKKAEQKAVAKKAITDKPTPKPTVKPAKSAIKKAVPVKAAEAVKTVKDSVTVKPAKEVAVAKPIVKTTKTLNIDEVAAVRLLEALAIRAKYSTDAAATYEEVKALLLK